MKIKNNKVFSLYNTLANINSTDVPFRYAIMRNIAKLKPEVEALQKVAAPSEDYQKYDSERVELAKSHADLGENKQPILKSFMSNGQILQEYQIKDRTKFDKELKILQKKHQKAVDGREKQLKGLNKLLEEEIEFIPYLIKFETIPTEISPGQIAGFLEIVEGVWKS